MVSVFAKRWRQAVKHTFSPSLFRPWVSRNSKEGPRGREKREEANLQTPLVQKTPKLTVHHRHSEAHTIQKQEGPSDCFIGVSSLKMCVCVCVCVFEFPLLFSC